VCKGRGQGGNDAKPHLTTIAISHFFLSHSIQIKLLKSNHSNQITSSPLQQGPWWVHALIHPRVLNKRAATSSAGSDQGSCGAGSPGSCWRRLGCESLRGQEGADRSQTSCLQRASRLRRCGGVFVRDPGGEENDWSGALGATTLPHDIRPGDFCSLEGCSRGHRGELGNPAQRGTRGRDGARRLGIDLQRPG